MAEMNCPVCGEPVESGAPVCPHCNAHIIPREETPLPPPSPYCRKRSFLVKNIRASCRENLLGPVGGSFLSFGVTTLLCVLFMLSNGGSYLPAILFLGAPTLFFLFRSLQQLVWFFRPSLHPAFRRMLPYGDPDSICLLAEKELRRSVTLGRTGKAGKYRLSPRFVFTRSSGRFAVIPVDDLIWVTLRRSRVENDEAPPTENHDVVLVDYQEKKTLLHFEDPVAAQTCIGLIRAQCPWLIFSRSPKTRRYVHKHANTLHRQSLRRRMDYQEALANQEAAMDFKTESPPDAISDNQQAI